MSYTSNTFEQLTQEFKHLPPHATRAFEVVPLMYIGLTLVDGPLHKALVGENALIQGSSKHMKENGTRIRLARNISNKNFEGAEGRLNLK